MMIQANPPSWKAPEDKVPDECACKASDICYEADFTQACYSRDFVYLPDIKSSHMSDNYSPECNSPSSPHDQYDDIDDTEEAGNTTCRFPNEDDKQDAFLPTVTIDCLTNPNAEGCPVNFFTLDCCKHNYVIRPGFIIDETDQ